MNEPVRLSEGDDDVAKRLLLALREERAPAGASQRALVALGVGGATMAAGGGAAAQPIWIAALKWLGGGAALGLAISGGATIVAPSAPAPQAKLESVREEAPAQVTPIVETPRAAELAVPAKAPTKPQLPSQPTPVEPTPPVVPAPTVQTPSSDELAREVELLDRARSALSRGDAAGAIGELDRFSREFPRGRLSAEAFVVRLQALMRAGRTAEARALAERQLAQSPGSVHAERIRKIVGIGAAP